MLKDEWIIIRLSKTSILKTFDCEDNDLNDFFLNQSLPQLSDLLSVTYVMEENDVTIAFFSLANDKIDVQSSKSKSWWKENISGSLPYGRGKRWDSYPAVKLGRFGVHKDFQCQGIGSAILDYIKTLFVTNNRTGCKYITVDAYNNEKALKFYTRNGFEYLTDKDLEEDTRLMYFDLKTIHP